MVVRDDHRRLPQERKRFKPLGSKSWMTLDSSVGANVEVPGMRSEGVGQGQKTDVMEQCGERQMVQCISTETCG